MRRIEFRGKTMLAGDWRYGDLTHDADGDVRICGVKVHRSTVGQCTGAVDINSEDIYEGDIIRLGTSHFFRVVYDSATCGFRIKNVRSEDISGLVTRDHTCIIAEIVGNVWDNPELLKEETTNGQDNQG